MIGVSPLRVKMTRLGPFCREGLSTTTGMPHDEILMLEEATCRCSRAASSRMWRIELAAKKLGPHPMSGLAPLGEASGCGSVHGASLRRKVCRQATIVNYKRKTRLTKARRRVASTSRKIPTLTIVTNSSLGFFRNIGSPLQERGESRFSDEDCAKTNPG